MIPRIPEEHPLIETRQQCRIYSASIKKFNDHFEYVSLFKRFNTMQLTEGHVADLGSGECTFTIALAKAFPNMTFDCYELSDEMIAIANEQITQNLLTDRINVIKQDAITVTGNYDLVIANRFYHHVLDTKAFWNTVQSLSENVFITDGIRPESYELVNTLLGSMAPLFEQLYIEEMKSSIYAWFSEAELLNDIPAKYNLEIFNNDDIPLREAVITTINT